MTTVQKDTTTAASNNLTKKEKAQQPACSKKNKKKFVYILDKNEEAKPNEFENKKEESQQTELVQHSDATHESINVKESQVPTQKKENKQKKNKKKFVYTPEEKKDEKSNAIESQPIVNKQPQSQIKSEAKTNDNEIKENNSKKNNKKKFVYIPDKEEAKSDESKELNTNTKPTPKQNNNNNGKNNNNNNTNKNKNNNNKNHNNNKNNNKCNNNKNNNNNNNNDNNNNNRKVNQKIEKESEPVNYNTYFELDMHGSDPHAKRPLEWVPVIRDALFSALEKNVDDVRFIPGKGLHSNPEIGPILRILVLLTSRRLGFESTINPDNEGIIICKISNHSKSSAIVPHMPNKDQQEDLNHNDTLLKAFGMKPGDNLNIDNLSFQAVKSRFPHMPTICIAIICVKRTPKEAIEFAQSFEDSLRSENEISNENDNQELLTEMKMIEALEEKYGFNQEIIERVVREKRKVKKSETILDRISSEIPNNFFNYLTEFLLNFSHVPIETLLDSMKEGFYNPNEITQILNSKSWRGMQSALGVMKVDNKIKTDRTDGRPKFIPTIEIDLSKAGVQKAQMTLDKIMNGLGNGNFSEMVLRMAPKNQKSNKCTLSDIAMFLYNKANQEGFHIVRTRRADEKNNRYHFTIFNCKDEI